MSRAPPPACLTREKFHISRENAVRLTLSMLLAVSCVPAVAWPCSGAACDAMVVPVPAGGTIPENAPAVGFQDSIFSESMWDGGLELQRGAVTAVRLIRPDGGTATLTPVAANDGTFVTPIGGFAAGDTWQLATDGGSPCDTATTFTVGAPAPLPNTSATLAVSAFRVENAGVSLCGGASGLIQFALLEIHPTTEMLPWLGLARWELEVDGVNWSTSRFARVPVDGLVGVPIDGLHPVDVFHVQCRPHATDGGAAADGRLGPGMHAARLLARIAGVPTPVASNTLMVNFDCTTDTWDAGTPPGPTDAGCVDDLDAGSFCGSDAGLPESDGGFTDASLPDASAIPLDGGEPADAGSSTGGRSMGDGGVNQPLPENTGCGCTGAPVAPLLGAIVLWLARRRSNASP
jgi:hypothetical protein